jgi:hypothetical protein
MKKLGKTLVVIGLVLLVTEVVWFRLWGMVYEPAGNLIQVLFLSIESISVRRLIADWGSTLFRSHMELFWLGIALWISQRGE